MSWYGIDAVEKAVSRTRKALFEPFDFWKWVKLAIIIFFVGGVSANPGGSGTNYRMSPEELSNTSPGSDIIQEYVPHNIIESISSSVTSFTEYGLLIALIAAFILLFILLFYISSVMEFVFVESLVRNEVKFWDYSRRFLGKGFNLLLVRLALVIIFILLIGIAALPFIFSISNTSAEPAWFALLGGIVWIIGIIFLLSLLMSIISSFIGLAIPISIYRQMGILSALKLVFANFRKSWQQVLVYWVARIVLGLVLGILMIILFLIVLLVSVIISLVVDGILYFLFSTFTSDPFNWILLIPFIIIEMLMLFGILLLFNVPAAIFMKYHLLSFLETWFAGADIPIFDAPAPGNELDFGGSGLNSLSGSNV